MMRSFNSEEWRWYGKELTEKQSFQFPIEDPAFVDVTVRSVEPVQMCLITKSGDTLALDWGTLLAFASKLVGFAALEIISSVPFAIRLGMKTKWLEAVDPTRLVIPIQESANKPMQDLLREELQRYAGRLAAEGLLADDVSVAELLDDIENGDLEFDEEPDMFGLGYEERHKEWEERENEALQDEEGEEDGAADGEAAPAPGEQKDGDGEAVAVPARSAGPARKPAR